MNDNELNGLGEQPDVATIEAKKRNAPKYKQMYEEAKDLAKWRLAVIKSALALAAIGWLAFIISMVIK